jgi:hypothetical protein
LESGNIPVGDDFLRVRIGIAAAPVFIKNTLVQDKELRDYFGNTVNTASGAEIKVSSVGSLAFAIVGMDTESVEYQSLVDSGLDVITTSFTIEDTEYQTGANCRETRGPTPSTTRSGRLLNPQTHCEDLDAVHGFSNVIMFKVSP